MSIAVVDDDEAVLRSMRMLLNGAGFEVCCYASAEALLSEGEKQKPACIVSDVRLPGKSGLDLQKELAHRWPSVPIIMITGHGDIAMAVKAIKDGAFDFLEKPFDDTRLIESIRAALSRATALTAEKEELSELRVRLNELSPRQREVMELVARGLANKEIAAQLKLSPRTVENYRAWVMEKMGAKNLADLVRKSVILDRTGFDRSD